MNNAMPMGIAQGSRQVDCDPESVLPVEHACHAESTNRLGQAFALDVLHGNPAIGTTLARTVEAHQVWVTQGQHGLHGANKAENPLNVAGKLWPQHLERNL